MITRLCNYCKKEYNAEPRYLNRNQGIYCSRKCAGYAKYPLDKKFPDPNQTCAWCKITFYRRPSSAPSKSGLYFCCRQHKDEAQRLGGLDAIMPSHYGEGKFLDYRTIARQAYEEICNRCGWADEPAILVVHHRDHNRENNFVENLEILCPNCHYLHHYKTKSAQWART